MTKRTDTGRTAKSATRRFGLALLGVLVLAAATSIAVFALPSEPRFELDASPATQAVTPGQTATYAIALDRHNPNNGKFSKPVALSVTGLPADTSATFHPSPIPASETASSMTVETTADTPAGTYPLTITGTDSEGSDSAEVTLEVLPESNPNFVLSPRPTERTIAGGDSADFTIDIARSGGFDGPVAFAVSGLPKRTSGEFTPAIVPAGGDSVTLEVSAEDKAKAGTYPLAISAVGELGSSAATRSTSVALIIEEKKPFSITGDPVGNLAPGLSVPLDLELSNPHNFEIYVQELQVALDPHTSEPACSAATNFGVDQIPAAAYPIGIPAKSSGTLTELGVAASDLPAAAMHNLPVNQDACKGAEVHFQYSGTATK